MKRRNYLATLGSGALVAGAGCLDYFSSDFRIETILFEDLRDNPSAVFDATVTFDGEVLLDDVIELADREPASYRVPNLPEEAGEYDVAVSTQNLNVGEFSYPPQERDVADCVALRLSIESSGSNDPVMYTYDYTCSTWDSLTSSE